ncbi:Rieske (2Fe-2S) protein [Plantactinospora sp. B5E13]|uniref:Rieske (2Fe-2S) protein n=1 Tax=unclassified Plantactinospora TaxID=2631981 RepID=UPI00325EE9CC
MRALLSRLEQTAVLDRAGDRLQRGVLAVLRPQRVRDALHGVWLGHPLHPALVQLPVGAWTCSAILDLWPGQRRAATALVAVGTATALPAALAGVNDWASLAREQRRVGLVHAIANGVGVLLYAGSLAARLGGLHTVGRALGFAGLSAVSGGAFLGGHLAYKQASAVNHGAPELRQLSDGWYAIADLAALPERALLTRRIDEVSVLVYRQGDQVSVLLDRCAHQGGPLGEGELVTVGGRDCVQCPWHGSRFQLDAGRVVQGPAASDQQVLPTRVVGGVVQTRLP